MMDPNLTAAKKTRYIIGHWIVTAQQCPPAIVPVDHDNVATRDVQTGHPAYER